MFDITPIDNQFILEYLPEAKGEYIKVYLYGLMRCYHPSEELSLEQLSRELKMDEEDIRKAYRYWERRGLVRRISDHPPEWVYINLKQQSLNGNDDDDDEYAAFADAMYSVFDNGRRLHGAEIRTCFEWVEDLKLPQEAVIMLLKHMARVKGKDFSIQSADRMAAKMAEEKVRTIEDAEEFLSRDKNTWEAVRSVLRKLGKRGLPSEAQLDMYRKWRDEWHFSPEAIEEACTLTAKGTPSMGYLDAILGRMRTETPVHSMITKEDVTRDQDREKRLRSILKMLDNGKVSVENKALMDEIEQLYPAAVIQIGARECAQSGKTLEDLKKLLLSWKKKGLEDQTSVENYVAVFHSRNELLKKLQEKWESDEPRINDSSRKTVSRWQEELGISEELILQAAEYAGDAKKPMAYLDKILEAYVRQGIRTPAEAEKARVEFMKQYHEKKTMKASGKSVPTQSYQQRDYSGKQQEMMDLFIRMNGGEDNA